MKLNPKVVRNAAKKASKGKTSSSGNCGVGSGGFQPGNKCAKGGSSPAAPNNGKNPLPDKVKPTIASIRSHVRKTLTTSAVKDEITSEANPYSKLSEGKVTFDNSTKVYVDERRQGGFAVSIHKVPSKERKAALDKLKAAGYNVSDYDYTVPTGPIMFDVGN